MRAIFNVDKVLMFSSEDFFGLVYSRQIDGRAYCGFDDVDGFVIADNVNIDGWIVGQSESQTR